MGLSEKHRQLLIQIIFWLIGLKNNKKLIMNQHLFQSPYFIKTAFYLFTDLEILFGKKHISFINSYYNKKM